ncbi:MAG: GNAT family N-acetyltransferase [Chloroflexi bacterium]|nr:GNAT family N-acetyltransferase [Chloroflexota bacterium]
MKLPEEPSKKSLEINPLDARRQKEASGVLARAFFEDPLMRYYLPDPQRRKSITPYLMLASLRYCLFYGMVDTTPDLAGLACWLPPGKTELGIWGLLRAGLGVVPLRLGWEALEKVRAIEPVVDRIHRACVPQEHWYLMILGVDPGRQGEGIGSGLMAARLAQAGDGHHPCYLETMTEYNVAFYRKRGFEVVHETDLAPGGLHVWMMLKD